MAYPYVRTTWADRQVQNPMNFTVTGTGAAVQNGTLVLTPNEGTVTTTGTALTAATMNNIEQGIVDLNNNKLETAGGTITGNLTVNGTGTFNGVLTAAGGLTVSGGGGRVKIPSFDGSKNMWFTTGQGTEPTNLGYGWSTDGNGKVTVLNLGASAGISVTTPKNILDDGVGGMKANGYSVWSENYLQRTFMYQYLNANQTISGINQWVKIGFNVTQYDNLTEATPSGYSRFTAKTAGAYSVKASVYFTSVTGSPFVFVAIYKNGAEYMRIAGETLTAGQNNVLNGSTTVLMGVNDYLEVYYYSTATTATIVGSSDGTYFIVERSV